VNTDNDARCPNCDCPLDNDIPLRCPECCEVILTCRECGEPTEPLEFQAHDGICKCCYDDNHFGEEPPYDDEDE
jgi:hypothetical protein